MAAPLNWKLACLLKTFWIQSTPMFRVYWLAASIVFCTARPDRRCSGKDGIQIPGPIRFNGGSV